MIRRPPRSTPLYSSAASDVYKRQWNGCATGGSSLHAAYSAIKSGEYDLGVVVGFDKHPRGAFNPQPKEWGLDDWYGETGLMLTTQFFALKTQRYMHCLLYTSDAADE